MFNVLDTQSKKSLHEAYTLRRTIVWLWAITIVGIVFFLSLVPTAYSIYIQKQTQTEELLSLRASLVSKNVQFTESIISSTNRILELFDEHTKSVVVTPVLFTVLEKKTNDITFKSIQYQYRTEGAVLIIEGVSRNREALQLFAKSFEASPVFARVQLPISNFAKNKDIPFTLTLTLATKYE